MELIFCKKKILSLLAWLVLSFIIAPILVGLYLNPVEFNQIVIQRSRIFQNKELPIQILRTLTTFWYSGKAYIESYKITTPDYQNEADMFEFILSKVPNYSIVYPTEGFYYWNTTHPSFGSISGNIRLADLGEKKSVSFAYFPVGNGWSNKENLPSRSINLNVENGLITKEIEKNIFEIKYRGHTKIFKLPVENALNDLKLSDKEEFIGRIVDESGVVFNLIFNNETRSFYDILDEKRSIVEKYATLDNNILLGLRTKFAYLTDDTLNRKILIGVYAGNSKANNYFDGPGDQVPFWLNLKEKLNQAYPATMLGDGINDHGVYLNKPEWTRIAITPYQIYSVPKTLLRQVANCKSIASHYDLSTCVTKEWWNNSSWLSGIRSQLALQLKDIPPQIDIKIELSKILEEKLAGVQNEKK